MNQLVQTTLESKLDTGSKSRIKNKSNRLIRTLHVYTSMLMLLIMLFFTITGITLNHRDWFSSTEPAFQTEIPLPDSFATTSQWESDPLQQGHLLRRWLQSEHAVYGNKVSYEWEPEEFLLVIDIKQPGGFSIIEADIESGLILLEQQDYGFIATLNDLHMGRYSGDLWSLFIDLSALVMLFFTLTGFWLVIPQKKKRTKLFALTAAGSAVMGGTYLGVMLL
ncbi:PepSY-associated TM helix domain-containing protein [Neptuniibacter sp.]|uniref:PepSY-associated TM helix domain-containing protein n=1 Tax=Neptuniibacter sp. TaxID=1962643 RepID=UPI0026340613|nr:PepSY-associated TM helix domain-containing protein [Neptuniibacter sp.]MCP4595291.1 peptidase [Neptuniibacter sp.]